MDRSLCDKESQAELSEMLGFAPYWRNARLWPSSSKRANSCPLASAPFAAARSRCWGFDGVPRRGGLDYPDSCDDAVGRTLEDIGELAQERWFPDCAHASESGCAVKQAIDAGEPAPAFGALSCARAGIGGSACFRAASREGRRPVKRCGPVCFVLSLERQGKVFDVKERLNMNADLKKGWAWPGMLACVKRRSRLVGVVLALVSFVVAGCKINGAVEFQANGNTKFDFTFEDSRDSMAKIKQTCEGVRLIVEAHATFIDSPKVEDVTPAGGHLTCRVTSDKPFKGKIKMSERDGKYHFKYYGAHDDDDTDMSDFKTRIVVSMPGKVTRSSLGKVQGNKVILEDLDFLTYGVEITAEKESTRSASSSLPGKKADAASSSASGFPAWAWAAVGGGVLVVIAGLAFVAGRRRGAVKAAARRKGGIPSESGGFPPSDGGVSPHQQAFGDGPGQDPQGRSRSV